MALEIEAKLKIDSHESVIEKLSRLDAEYRYTLRQADYYFDDSQSSMVKGDQCLRLRVETIKKPDCLKGCNDECILTYKGAKGGGRYKSREEIETSIDSGESMLTILERIGYSKSLAFDKRRDVWLWGGCEVCLDTLPMIGCFVEIEGGSEDAVWKVQKELGLETLEHEKLSYACLLRAKLDDIKDERREVFLDLEAWNGD